MLFGEKLAEVRRVKKLTPKQLAEQSGVPYKTITHYERTTKGLPQMRLMARLLKVLDVPWETFADCDDVRPAEKAAA